MQVTVYNQQGKEIEKITLNKEIFGIEPNPELVHQALLRQHDNGRQSNAHTKTRAEVRGGGRKPYRQKGTGRARQGSIRSPQFIGGGTVFGPRSNRNFETAMPKKQRRKALFSALSSKANTNAIFVLDKYEDGEAKTANFAKTIKSLPIKRNSLIVVDGAAKELISRVSGNMPNVKSILVSYVNIADLLKYQTIVFLKDALPELENTFLTSNK